MRKLAFLSGLALAITSAAAAVTADGPKLAAEAWEVGPVIRGKNYSVGMPLHPAPEGSGWSFDFPYPSKRAGHVNALTFDPGTLAGKKSIVLRYRIDAAPGVRFVPQESQDQPGTITMFLQRRGDNWTARGRFEAYRWYAGQAVTDITPGVHQITVDLRDPKWAAVMTSTAGSNPRAFQDALNNAGRVGFVFGAREGGAGHGVFATGPARFTLLSFQIR